METCSFGRGSGIYVDPALEKLIDPETAESLRNIRVYGDHTIVKKGESYVLEPWEALPAPNYYFEGSGLDVATRRVLLPDHS